MPKATLSFKLPEERDEFDLAYQGARLSCIIDDLDNYLRNRLKYDELTEEQYACYERVRIELTRLRNE